ncbi:hypothetical protein ACFQPA_03705 [Halomarina halobia]|uniref:DUF2087 domain-containing protein n=1 Tax=Halomarina halobia TaxID=3033386 RepID=A0ABD6A585_9EURY|nr:hypothetical protein [Halomarina sp. PSR21]
MKFKVVPEPRPPSFARDAARALPLVPGTEDDCCARLMADAGLPSRDVAKEWITFLRALGLAAESDGGYYRTRADPTDADLARAFRERVHTADDVLATLEAAEEPISPEAAYERVRGDVPQWERSRRTDWERVWRERVRRILEWAVAFDLAERVEREGGTRYRG